MTRGVIYFNSGLKMIPRLAVSAHTLRQHYDGPVCILSQGDNSHGPCQEVADRYGFQVKPVVYDKTPKCRSAVFLNATLAHTTTPFDVSMWLDSDTLVLGDFTKMLDMAEIHEFAIAQFSNWKSHGRRIRKRLEQWRPHWPELVDAALRFGPAINCGVFAFRRDSALMQDWYRYAVAGKAFWIPDETSCQLLLPQYPAIVMPPIFNVSCKYALPVHVDDCRVFHMHGRKHCRIVDGEYQYHSDKWYAVFEEIRDWSLVQEHICKDPQLRGNLPKHDELKERADGD